MFNIFNVNRRKRYIACHYIKYITLSRPPKHGKLKKHYTPKRPVSYCISFQIPLPTPVFRSINKFISSSVYRLVSSGFSSKSSRPSRYRTVRYGLSHRNRFGRTKTSTEWYRLPMAGSSSSSFPLSLRSHSKAW
jgi:hypothetical protein